MDAPRSLDHRPRADLIRELLARGMRGPEIKRRCVELTYDEPTDQAISRAKHYKYKGLPALRPSYYWLWKQFLTEYDSAYNAGKPIVLTRVMHELVSTAQACVTHDLSGEPLTDRKRRKNKPK